MCDGHSRLNGLAGRRVKSVELGVERASIQHCSRPPSAFDAGHRGVRAVLQTNVGRSRERSWVRWCANVGVYDLWPA